VARRRDAIGVGTVGQREPAVEAPVLALDSREALAVVELARPLALDGEQALVHLHGDVRGVHARDVGIQDEAIGFFLDVDQRDPLAGDDRRLVPRAALEKTAFKKSIEYLADRIGGSLSAPLRKASHLVHCISPVERGSVDVAQGPSARENSGGATFFKRGVPAPLASFKDRQREIKGEDDRCMATSAAISYDATQPLNDPRRHDHGRHSRR
jgi:hypothetical protein